jgi:hypothetical protein
MGQMRRNCKTRAGRSGPAPRAGTNVDPNRPPTNRLDPDLAIAKIAIFVGHYRADGKAAAAICC